MEPVWTDAIFDALKGLPNVLDIRQFGITAAIDLGSRPDAVGKRGFEAMERGFHEHGIVMRAVGDTLAVTPPLILTNAHVGEIADKLAAVIKAVA